MKVFYHSKKTVLCFLSYLHAIISQTTANAYLLLYGELLLEGAELVLQLLHEDLGALLALLLLLINNLLYNVQLLYYFL